MRRFRNHVSVFSLALLMALGVLATPAGSPASTPVSASALSQPVRACTTTGYTVNCTGCVKVPSRGNFALRVPKSPASLLGSGSSATRGTTICVAQVAPPRRSLGGVGIRVSVKGRFSPLRLSRGKLYRWTASNNRVTQVRTLDRAGIYQVVAR